MSRHSIVLRSASAVVVSFMLTACASAPPRAAEAPESAPGATPRTLPTPFTAAQIRAANPPGTVLVMRIEQSGQPVVLQEIAFVDGDETRAVLETRALSEDGRAVGPVQRTEASWSELRDHAAFPAALASRESMTCTVPAGRFEGWLYTVRDDTTTPKTDRFYFATDRPGPPVLFETEAGGQVTFRMSLIEVVHRVSGS